MMIKIKSILIGLSIVFLFSACGAKKKVKSRDTTKRSISTDKESKASTTSSPTKNVASKPVKTRSSASEYIETYAHIAVSQMKEHKIPASITLAQGILESNSGNSQLTQNSNNHFGIKCHKNWEGLRTYYDDDSKGECFRVYKNPATSFQDHALFLTKRTRYEGLFKLRKGDYKAWARGLQKAGYATDKKYPQKLIHIIEKYELYKYDDKVLGKKTTFEATPIADPIDKEALFYIVKKGDGLYSISRKHRLKVRDLKAFNNLSTNTIYPGQKLYLKPVVTQVVVTEPVKTDTVQSNVEIAIPKSVADIIESAPTKIDTIPPKQNEIVRKVQQDFHIVKEKETLYQIAYMYNLEIPDIRRWNGIKKEEIHIGQKLAIKKPKQRSPVQNDNKTHVVVKGDTLFSIARRYGLTVRALKSLNHLQDNTISIDQILLVE